ncbi:MAG: redoxin domain-containing protein [Chloroflexota bacterium]
MQTRDRRPLLIGGGVILLVILAVVAFVPLGGSSAPTPAPGSSPAPSSIVIGGSPLLGKPAPAFALQDLAGNTVSLADYAGRPVIVNWWASWCIPCREEFPIMVAGLEQHKDQGLEILGIVYKDSATNAQAFATDHDAHWPLLQDPDAKTWSAYYGIGVPMTAFIDGKGIVQAMSYGPLSQDGFDSYVKQILPAS